MDDFSFVICRAFGDLVRGVSFSASRIAGFGGVGPAKFQGFSSAHLEP